MMPELFKKYIKILWISAASAFLLLSLFISSVALGLFGTLPGFEELENPQSLLASEIIASDGAVLGKYYIQNRSNVKFEQLPPHLVQALIATEDIRFENHSGIDLRGLLRVVFKTVLLRQKSSGGGSTVTQQLAKNLFPRTRFDNLFTIVITKTKEWITAVRLERRYTKREILTMYLNTVDFGSNSFGIKSAASTYYGKVPDSLKIEESAVLVGLLKATSLYSPVRNPENALARRNTVLSQMYKYGFITRNEYDSVSALPVDVSDYTVASHQEGLATYFREVLRMELQSWFDQPEHYRPDGKPYNLYKDGLKIYVTIDSRMQKLAEEAVREHLAELQDVFFDHWKGREPWGPHEEILTQAMVRTPRYADLKAAGLTREQIRQEFDKPIPMTVFSWRGAIDTVMSPMDSIKYHKHFLRAGFMSQEPGTGYVRTWVGGPDYRFFQYDQVKMGRRQVGSTFKPFVYTVAMDNGWDPCLLVPNQPVTFEDFDDWTPKNSDGTEGGMFTLKEGLARSVNLVTAYIMKQIGPQSVVNMARNMGITTEVEPFPSIALGTPDVTLYDMVGAYSTYVSGGVWSEPVYLVRIEDKYGNTIYEKHGQKRVAMSERTAYIMLDLLKGTTTLSGGTGLRLRGGKYNITYPVAGKTGTTQNNSDGWFIGCTPDLVSGSWVGCEDRSVHFRSTHLGQGANTALPIWALFMNKLHADPELHPLFRQSDFPPPAEPLGINLNCNTRSTTVSPADKKLRELGF